MGHGGSRRPSGRALLGGFGLLAMVLTVGIMAMLAVRVLDSSPVTSEDSSSGVLEQLGGPAQTDAPDGPSSPSAGSDAARRSACATDRSTLELAVAAYRTLNGTSPPDQAALIDQGLLRSEVLTHRLVSSGDEVDVVGAVDCVDE